MILQKMSTYLFGSRRDSIFPSKEPGSPPLSPVIQQLIDNMVHVEGGTFMMGSDLEEDNKCITDDEHPASMERPDASMKYVMKSASDELLFITCLFISFEC